MSTDSLILAELMNDPMALVSPIVRNGSRVTVGADEAEWKRWVELENRGALIRLTKNTEKIQNGEDPEFRPEKHEIDLPVISQYTCCFM